MICTITGALVVNNFGLIFIKIQVEPLNHIWNSMKTLNLAYQWPRDSKGWSIFLRESTRIPNFYSDFRKK